MVEEPCFLRTKKERIHKSSSYSIASSLKKCKPFFQFFPDFSAFQRSCIQVTFYIPSVLTAHSRIQFFFPLSLLFFHIYFKTSTSRILFFHIYFKTSTSRILFSVSNTLWAFRVSFEIRHLRRLSQGSADPREHSRSWWLAQSYPAHVADREKYPAGASSFTKKTIFLIYLSR